MPEKITPEELEKKLKDEQLRAAFYTRLMQRVVLAALPKAQLRTPVRTGTLRRSETTRVERGGRRGFLGSNVIYAAHVHERVPFFRLGVDDARGDIRAALEAEGADYMEALIT